MKRSTCDRCGGVVQPNNSVIAVQELATGKLAGFVRDRHLYPVGTCPGSPSRVKLVKTDAAWREAYQKTQQGESS